MMGPNNDNGADDGKAVCSSDPKASPASKGPDYAALLRAVTAGSRDAEAHLMQALAGPLRVVLRRRVGDDIDDLQQETLLVVLASAREGRIGEPQALVYFALETARRLLANEVRKQHRQRTDTDDDLLARVAAQGPSGEDLATRRDVRRAVWDVLQQLPNARDREILRRYYLDEEPSSALQARFSMNSTQLGRVLHRARQRFGDALRRMRPGLADDQ